MGRLAFGWEADFLDGPLEGRREIPFAPTTEFLAVYPDGVRVLYQRDRARAGLAYRSFTLPSDAVG